MSLPVVTAAEISVPRAEPVGITPGQPGLPQLLPQGLLGAASMGQILAGQANLQTLSSQKGVASRLQDIKNNLVAANRNDNRVVSTPFAAAPPSFVMLSNSKKKATSGQVKRSCINCKLAKTRCDNERPCRRCLRTGREATCVDSVHKKRGRKRSVNPAAAAMKARISDMNLDLDMFAKQQKLMNDTGVNSQRTEVKHTLTYVETLLTVCNQQLERWNNKLRQANKMPQPLSVEMRNCKNSLKAYQWIAACMLKNLQNVVKISSSKDDETDEAKAEDASADQSGKLESSKPESNKIDPREVFYGTLPIGVAVFSLQPSPFHPSNKPWVNKTLAGILGYTPAEMTAKLSSLKGLASLYHIVNLRVTIRLFMEALSHRKENYSVQTKWIHKNGDYLDILESVSIKYEASGVPVSVSVFFQKMSENKVMG
mmetsp:Transcript_24096/g.42653  ORF Transcript_24096/g.42653 Transcript_24096/m.42653 type:complete len:427 (+) Transcript_24096:59-1339(+)|eukprot:CAMPEP_0197519426 /NCGR_PEP_ID=MMETSP1318-20131121/4698_1 /TAXON_ID=552666 /ORGANISM="Partenskyella glossopodia, Strain RCC365" /LENGTH=426 /DNA_ID=CAMNT_0043070397 /DNA_START=54 /DNA_END=1334 /DNA_ORIENTATION=+